MATTYYVGVGGDNGQDGTTWAKRKLTLNGVEDIPVVAGDTVYVGAGTYRELLTVDVSGSAEAGAISYIGDYDGSHTDGVGGVVRITGSDNDLTGARASCITGTTKHYRTFQGFVFDISTSNLVSITTSTNWTIDKCYFGPYGGVSAGVYSAGAGQAGHTISNCVFMGCGGNTSRGVYFYHSSQVTTAAHVVSNCVVHMTGHNNNACIATEYVEGLTVKNCTLAHSGYGVRALNVSASTVAVNNCVITGHSVAGLAAGTLGFLVEDYNAIYACAAARSNVGDGAHSNAYPMLLDTRWFYELVGGGSVLSPFDMASYCQLVNVAGTSPTSTDMRGTSVQGAQREWGALEYDSTLEIEGGGGRRPRIRWHGV